MVTRQPKVIIVSSKYFDFIFLPALFTYWATSLFCQPPWKKKLVKSKLFVKKSRPFCLPHESYPDKLIFSISHKIHTGGSRSCSCLSRLFSMRVYVRISQAKEGSLLKKKGQVWQVATKVLGNLGTFILGFESECTKIVCLSSPLLPSWLVMS